MSTRPDANKICSNCLIVSLNSDHQKVVICFIKMLSKKLETRLFKFVQAQVDNRDYSIGHTNR